MPKIYEHAKNILRLMKGTTAQDHGNNLSVNVHARFYLLFFFLAATCNIHVIKRICASRWFVRMENDNCKPNNNN